MVNLEEKIGGSENDFFNSYLKEFNIFWNNLPTLYKIFHNKDTEIKKYYRFFIKGSYYSKKSVGYFRNSTRLNNYYRESFENGK